MISDQNLEPFLEIPKFYENICFFKLCEIYEDEHNLKPIINFLKA